MLLILKQIVQPFTDLRRLSRAMWGVQLGYMLDGMVYFGILSLLSMYFNQYIGLSDQAASPMVGLLTWGITLSMSLLGGFADRWTPQRSLTASLSLMAGGRALWVAAVFIGLPAAGLWSPIFWFSIGAIVLIVIGNGIYQPAAYAAIGRYSTPQTKAMNYAMLYALMNLGAYLPSWFSPQLRHQYGIAGVFTVYTVISFATAFLSYVLLRGQGARLENPTDPAVQNKAEMPPKPRQSLADWLKHHPLADTRFSFFIFVLIPVQTLFAHSWLTLPLYVERAFTGSWISQRFEIATNLNPILIFFLVPIITAATQKVSVYRLMVVGTLIMAVPTFLLCLGPTPFNLFAFIIIRTVGEALWQPRFLQLAADMAPPDQLGSYMGIAQFPWFLTKMLTSLYAGWFVQHYCPAGGPLQTERMWFIHGAIAMISPLLLVAAGRWLRRGLDAPHPHATLQTDVSLRTAE